MKRRRTMIVSLLLVAALCLGIGYAAMTSTLLIDGNATVVAHAMDVRFVGATFNTERVVNTDTPLTYDVPEDPAPDNPLNHVTLDVGGFSNVGDTVITTFQVKNDGDAAATLTELTLLDANDAAFTSEYFDITTSLDGEATLAIATGATEEVTVTVRLKKAYYKQADQDPAEITESFYITIHAQQDE